MKELLAKYPALKRLGDLAPRKPVEFIAQHTATDCGPTCLSMVLAFFGREVRIDEVRVSMGCGRDGTSAFAIVYFPLRILEGDSLTNVVLWVTGGSGVGHGGVLPGTLPRLRLLEQAPLFGAYASLASRTDPSGSAAVYDASHGFGFSSGLPVTAQDGNYLLEVRGENAAGGATNELRIDGIEVTITRRQLVSTNIL